MENLKTTKSFNNSNWVCLALIVIILLGLSLRMRAVLETEVDLPFRADAGQYYMYAYNLNNYGLYSSSFDGYGIKNANLKLDSYRTPGYPLFLALFVNDRDSSNILIRVLVTQALLSVIVIFLVYKISLIFLPPIGSLIAALLTSLSPHYSPL
jgi:hypothetical protein